jgi:hypothetical protein
MAPGVAARLGQIPAVTVVGLTRAGDSVAQFGRHRSAHAIWRDPAGRSGFIELSPFELVEISIGCLGPSLTARLWKLLST